jgi:ketosteroid isomerase-like protein
MTTESTELMSETDTKVSSKEAADLVSAFYESLARGRMVDALDLVATDAVMSDEAGNESRGIGAIARSLLPYREPDGIALERIESTGPDVHVQFRTKKRARRYRGSISVDRGRIRSVRLERTP